MAQRELKVKITADGKNLERNVDKSKKSVSGLEDAAKKAGMALVGAFAARAVFNGLKNLVVGLGNAADRLLDLEQITAINIETLQEYEYVAKIAGVNTEALANASMGLTQRLARATTESSPLNVALAQLGINAKNAAGEIRNGGDIMDDVIQQLADMENITERNVLGSQIFAGAWKDMAPILSMGADGIQRAREEARDLGLVLDRQALMKANEMRQSMERLGAVSKGLGNELALLLVPAVAALAEGMSAVVKEVNILARGLRSIRESENLTFWQKLGTQARLMLGLATQDAHMLGGALATVIETTAEYEEKLEEAARAAQEGNIQVIKQLGDIASLDAQIAEAKQGFIDATSEAERTSFQLRLNQLEKERQKLIDIAHARALASGLGAPTRMEAAGAVALPTVGIMDGEEPSAWVREYIDSLEELEIKMREVSESMIDWSQIATGAAASIGMGFMQMAQDGSKSVSDIIKQTLAQVTAQLISQIVTAVPFPANIALAAGAGVMAGGLFNQIPAFADGGRVTSPTLAMFGEYPGARTNPEYALREDQLKKVVGGGGKLEARFSRDEMIVWLNEGERRQKNSF